MPLIANMLFGTIKFSESAVYSVLLIPKRILVQIVLTAREKSTTNYDSKHDIIKMQKKSKEFIA